MRPSSVSYLKTTALAALLGALVIGLTRIAALNLAAVSRTFVEGAGWLVGLAIELVALAGVVALYRNDGLARGHPDLFLGRLVISNVGHRPDELAITGSTLYSVSYRVDVLDSPVS